MGTKSFSFFLVVSLFCLGCSHTPKQGEGPETPVPKNLPHAQPKIGLVLGPGGLKSFAHIGVLREFERAHIQINNIVGLEWGALVGGLYSMSEKSNDVEWRMLKIKEDDLPRPSLFGGSSPKNRKALKEMIKRMTDYRVKAKPLIGFACLSQKLGEEAPNVPSGALADVLAECVPQKPFFKTEDGGGFAVLTDIREAAQKSRDLGADVVVFVNVLAAGKIYDGKDAATQAEWEEIQSQLASANENIDFVIGVHTREFGITNFEARRSQILFGSQAGVIAVRKLSDKFGLR
jgi:NTE family protein